MGGRYVVTLFDVFSVSPSNPDSLLLPVFFVVAGVIVARWSSSHCLHCLIVFLGLVPGAFLL